MGIPDKFETTWKCGSCGIDVGVDILNQLGIHNPIPGVFQLITNYLNDGNYERLLHGMEPILKSMEHRAEDIYPGYIRCQSCDFGQFGL